jgi:phosphate-selective porin
VVLGAAPVGAQSVESDPAPGVKVPPPPPGGYFIPDVPDTLLAQTKIKEPGFTIGVGLAMLFDYTSFWQDDASVAQVGVQDDQFEVRDARLTVRGTFQLAGEWRYLLQGQYKGFDRDATDEDDWSISEVSFKRSLGPKFGTLMFGKMKQTHSYEMVGDAANLPQSERLLSPFFTSRDVGIRLYSTMLDQRGTWTVGWFNDWWVKDVSFSESGNQFTTRVTYLPVWADSGTRYVHLGISGRYNGADEDRLRFSGRPESNVADIYVDTDNIPSDHAWHIGLEALWADGRYSVLGEYVQAWVSSPETGDPSFWGWYLTGS